MRAGDFKGDSATVSEWRAPPALNILFRAFGRGALCFAYIHVRLTCAHTTMHRMVVSPRRWGYADNRRLEARGRARPLLFKRR